MNRRAQPRFREVQSFRGTRLRILLASGSTILIGSERPDELVSVLHRHVPTVSSA